MSVGKYKTKEGSLQLYKQVDHIRVPVPLSSTKQEKDIRVIIGESLSYIMAKINKENSILGLIRRSFDYLDVEIFGRLYKALEHANCV